MKKFTTLLLGLSLAVSAIAQQNFEVMTKKPTPGSEIVIEYMPRNTVLQGAKDFEATAYLLEGKLPLAKEITLKQEGGIFRGKVKTNDSTRAVFFTFAKEDKQDNNNDEGYYTPLFDKKGNEVPGAKVAVAAAFQSYGSIWGLKRNREKAAELNKQEFANPVAREKFFSEYVTFLSQSKDEADKELLKAALAKQLENKALKEADLMRIKGAYEVTLKDKEKTDAVYASVKEKFPAGDWKRTEEFVAVSKESNLEKRAEKFSKFLEAYPPATKEQQQVVDNMARALAIRYADSSNFDKAVFYGASIKNRSLLAQMYNNLALKLAGGGIAKKPVDVARGLALSKKSLELLTEEMKAMDTKPSYQTEKQYKKDVNWTYHYFHNTYATLLYQNNELDNAYAAARKAVDHFERKNMATNETFAVITEKAKGAAAARAELEKFLEEGKYTPAMKDQLKTLYTAAGNTEAQWAAYVNNLEETAYNKLKAELAKTMIKLPAPQFALKDMDGKEVALSSLKGKVVVVDFWATWCGPCIASFPGMQKTLEKYKDNKDVAFLFIDTWENDSNRVQKVTDFIAKNKYTFHVLYDDPKAKEGNSFVVVEDFKVDGIPTKFVIDRNSNIRFKSVGWNGSTEGIVNEMTAMIDMAAADSGEPIKKAF